MQAGEAVEGGSEPRRIGVVEIGGTKLQWACSPDRGASLEQLGRVTIDRAAGARGILDTLERALAGLFRSSPPEALAIGFGGPVDSTSGVVVTSHQIAGWDRFPLADHFRRRWGVPVYVANDCNVAALAEARWGAGRDRSRVFYVTVGTGIGGGMVIDGQLDGATRAAVAEIGHLRPGLEAEGADETVESWASGLGISRRAAGLGANSQGPVEAALPDVPAVIAAAQEGDRHCTEVLRRATRTLGWAIAQTVTLLAPDVVVIGGGVSAAGEDWFWGPLREQVDRYVFPPLRGQFQLLPALLGDRVVLHGAGCLV